MKKQIATISILILFLVFSSSSIKVSAWCGRPKCTQDKVAAATPASAVSAQDPAGQQTIVAGQPEDALRLILLAAQWAMSFPYFL